MSVYQIKEYIKHRLSANKKGFGIHSPFVFEFVNAVLENKEVHPGFNKIETIRRELLINDKHIDITDLGAGSMKLQSDKRKISDIAKYSLKSAKQAQFLVRLAHFVKAKEVIELGTSLGITTLYLSLANAKAKIHTIEGDENIFEIANNNFNRLQTNNIINLLGNFDQELPNILNKVKTIDFAFIDGNHTKQATINYFNLLKEKTHKNSVIVFDDIYWTKDMTTAWNTIQKDEKVSISIDVYHLGLVFFNKDIPKQDFKLFSKNL